MPGLDAIVFLSPSSIGTAIEVTVADINSPTELNGIAASSGDIIIARTVGAATDQYTFYIADTTSDAQSLPWIVSSSTAGVKFIASAGHAVNNSVRFASTIRLNSLTASRIVTLDSSKDSSTPATITTDQSLSLTGSATVTVAGLTASRLVRTDGSKALESNAALTNTHVLYADSSGWPTGSANFIYDGTAAFVTSGGGSPFIGLIQSASNSSDGLSLRKRGNAGGATNAVASGAEIGYHSFAGWDGSSYGRGAYVITTTTEAFTGSAHGCKYEIYTTPTGSTTNTLAMKLDQDQGATFSAYLRGRAATVGAFAIATATKTDPATISGWDATQHTILVGPANSTTASALAVSHNQTTHEASFVCITPGVAWRKLSFYSMDFQWNPSGSTTNNVQITSGGAIALAATTDSTSSSTGTIQTAGGAVITKNLLALQGSGRGLTSTATAAGTTTLTSASKVIQIFTGTTTQTLQLPAANLFGSNIAVEYVVINRSTGTVTAQRAGSDTFDGGGTTDAILTNTTRHYFSNGSNQWHTIA